MGKKLNTFTCACLAALLSAKGAAKKHGEVIDLRPTIEYIPPEGSRTVKKPTNDHDDIKTLLRRAEAHPRIPRAQLRRFSTHRGYKLVFDKGTNSLYLLSGSEGVAVFSARRSNVEGDKKISGDQRTPEGIFISERPSVEQKRGFVVWIALNTAARARDDYIKLHGQRGRQKVAEFEQRHGSIASNAHVLLFNKSHALRGTRMWTGIGIHGRISDEQSQTQGCISLDPRDALELHRIIREPIPVLILGHAVRRRR
ncbi:L,D-transpeptidase [Candidatus Micrarchaeota archaeon]|nr:L,D-transpeptidase [Candidatus Micrarchaeota archaeon]